MKKRVFFGIIILFVFLTACTEEGEPEEEVDREVAVETEEVKEGDFIMERSVFGRAAPNLVTPITLPAPGEVEELEVKNGDQVEDGDRIAIIRTAQGNLNINAEADGEIGNLKAKEDEFVSNEESFAIISDTEEMIIDFSLSAAELERFTVDETYQLRKGDTEWESTLTMLDTMPGENGLYAAQATVPNPDGHILTGQVFELLVPEKVEEDTLIVPTEAIITENSEDFVYVIIDHKAELRSVTVLHKGSVDTAVEGEITAGDSIVTVGQLTLADGDTVIADSKEGE